MNSAALALYHHPKSRSASARVLLEALGVPYGVEFIDFTAGMNRTPEFRALNPLGKLPTLVHGVPGNYFVNEDFRRELRRVLNRGEAVNALRRAIYTGRVGPAQARRADEMQALANFCPANLNELNTTARRKLRSAQRRPSIIAACWAQAELW